MMSVCLMRQEPQTVWIDCPRDAYAEKLFFFSVLAAFRLRGVVSNRSRTLGKEVKDMAAKLKHRIYRQRCMLLPNDCVV